MKCSDIHNLSSCELTMLAASMATNLTNGLDEEQICELQNFLNLLSANINAIKCEKQCAFNRHNKKDGNKPSEH